MSEPTERELIELAAKAYGFTWWRSKYGHWNLKHPDGEERSFCMGWPHYDATNGEKLADPTPYDALNEFGWYPLSDDADALRLAVKLNLHVEIDCESAGAVVIEWDFNEGGQARHYVEQSAPVGGDDYDATRRAIVLAAAEIGRGIP